MRMQGLLGAAAVLAAASVLATGAAAGSASYTDPAGDAAPGVADVQSVAVSDDAASGMITVTVGAPGFSAPITDGSERDVFVALDTDKNPATGNLGGAEYMLEAGNDASGPGWDIEHWDGTAYGEVAQSPTMGYTRSGDSMTWRFSKLDIGSPTGFSVLALSGTVDQAGNVVGIDRAPDGGSWNYDLSAPAPAPAPTTPTTTTPTTPTTTTPAPLTPAVIVRPVIGKPVTIPARATAGARFTVMFPVIRSDTRAPLTTGKMVCDPSVNGKVIKHAESFKGGKAQLSFLVPKTAKGNMLKVKVTINVGTLSTTRIANFRIV